MRVLVIGAGGFIGSAVTARLAADGHSVVAACRAARRPTGLTLDRVAVVRVDVARNTAPDDWLPHLDGIDAVVNCAGVLQDSPGESASAVHVDGVAALAQACERAGVRRIVHLSAVGVDLETPSEFSRTKLRGDQAIMARDLDWVILRPSVVVGRGAYGASALLRGLAALPVAPVVPQTAPLQVIQLDDLVEAIIFFLRSDAPAGVAVDAVGPRQWSFRELVRLFRRWLRWPPAREVELPAWAMQALYRLGDFAALLGWRTPLRSTAGREIARGAIGDGTKFMQLTGIVPRDLEGTLAREAAPVQERWFAALYILKPLVFAVLALFWISTGVIALGPGWVDGMAVLREGNVDESTASLVIVAGALADIVIGVAIAVRPLARYGLIAALVISVTYAIIGTVLVPRLWTDPLGPMLKIWPVMVLNVVALAIRDAR